jgi:hypothetical protein
MGTNKLENMLGKSELKKFDKEHPDKKRVELINQLVSDCEDGYCTARMIIGKNKNSPVTREYDPEKCAKRYEYNCHGQSWCPYREALYKSPMTERTLIQLKMIEVRKYLDDLHNKTNEPWDEADAHWADFVNGDLATFRYVIDDLGIKDLPTIKRLCVDSVVDNLAIVEPISEYKI